MSFSTSSKSVYGATMLITGCCIGAGMIGFPVKTALAGFLPSTVAMVFCYLFTTITGLLILEATLWFDQKVSFSTIVESTLGKKGKYLTLLLFLALFYSLSVAYLDASGIIFSDIFSSLTGYVVPKSIGIIFSAAFVAAFTYAGTHIANRLNQVLLLGLVVTYISLIIIGLSQASMTSAPHVSIISTLNVIPIMLISFGYQNLVPSITYYLNKNARHIRFAIIVGNFIPLLVYTLWNYVILGILPADAALHHAEIVTQLLEGTASVISIVVLIKTFSLCALVTSFIPNSISLVDFIKDASRNSLHKIIKSDLFYIGLVFVPAFLFTTIYPNLFLSLLDFAGGFIDVLLFGILPALIVLLGRRKMLATQYQVFGGTMTPVLILIFSLSILLIKVAGLYVSFV